MGGRSGARLAALMSLLMLIALVLPFQAAAAPAANAKFDKLDILIQPEYDDPRVLAVLQGTLSGDTKLPMTASFLMSKKLPDVQIGMACEVPEGQGHRCKVYDTVEAGDFQDLTYAVDTARNLFFEYYWNPFKDAKDGKKTFVYEYKASYPVKELNVQIQEPLKATDYKVEPESKNLSQDQEGFKTHNYTFNDVTPGQVITFNVNYTKTDPAPSKPKATPQQQAGNQAPGTEQTGNPLAVRLMLFFFVLLFVAGILGVYWRSKMTVVETASPVAARPKPKGQKTAAKASSKASKSKFCSNCGNELSSADRFCSECGSGTV